MERRMTPDGDIKIETRAGGKRTIVGHAAVFHRSADDGTEYILPWGAVERIAPSAFDRALKERQDVRGLFNHDKNHLLGRSSAGTLRLTVDRRGLRYEIDQPDTQTGRDVAASIERGDLTGSSFAFMVREENWAKEKDGREIRTIMDVDLIDVGPVTFPAYEGTSTGVRAAEDAAEAMASYNQWRKAEIERRFAEVEATAGKSN